MMLSRRPSVRELLVRATSFATILLLCGCGLSQSRKAEDHALAEQYIMECSRDWAESVVTGDMSRRRIYFADDFLGTDTKGRLYDKSRITRDTGPAKHIVSNQLNDVKIRFYGDTAIAHGSESWERDDGSKGRYVWTDIWVRRNGQWRIVAAQDLPLVDEPGR